MSAASALPILTFHALDERQSPISFSPDLFGRCLAQLHRRRYRTLNVAQAADLLRRNAAWPERSVVITFDDGYRSVFDVAFPLLHEFEMTATLFLTVGEGPRGASDAELPAMCGRPMLSWAEIREMQGAGLSVGAHTLTHPDLTRLAPERMETEICRSKAILEDALGMAVAAFAYPYGCYDRRSRAVVERHFTCACSTRLGLARAGGDLYALERVDALHLRADRLFGLLFTGLLPWYLRARGATRRVSHVLRPDHGAMDRLLSPR
jgi:peptidoglycan/xylan/chitin deacetylase (PgdA/CDA1 family)